MSAPMLHKLQWGLPPDRECIACWGARAIFQDDFLGGMQVDILWDRTSTNGLPADVKKLCAWLDSTGLSLLRKAVRKVSEKKRSLTVVEMAGFRIIADPQASYGYLYICAMLLPEESKNGSLV